MRHCIDMSKYNIRTDLAIDVISDKEEQGFKKIVETDRDLTITKVIVDDEGVELLNKKKGNYITIEFVDITDSRNFDDVKEVFAKYLKELLDEKNIKLTDEVLIIGLGNDKSTPDALGPNTIEGILVTKHLFTMGVDVDDGYRSVAAINPGVMGETGIETSEMIKSITKMVKPKLVIIVDSLASSSLTRVNKTIQMTDTGIHPGSGVGNTRKEIDEANLGIPVIAIGVPTVVDAVTIVGETMNYMVEHFKSTSAQKEILGLLVNLSDEEMKALVEEVLSKEGFHLIVTPKEVDFMIEKLSLILSSGINMALHPKVTE